MQKVLDSLLLFIWKLLTVSVQTVLFLLAAAFRFFAEIIRIFFKIDIPKKLDSGFFGRCLRGEGPFGFLSSGIRSALVKTRSRIETSNVFRRCIFLAGLMLLIFFLYPPSHWGPWHLHEKGVASHYSAGCWFKRTASGERFIPLFHTAAHPTLPLGTTVKLRNLSNNKVVYVRINDRGPFIKDRVIDISSGAASKLDMIRPGIVEVEIYTRKKYPK
ncbi:MAG: septal ring lytic transglycosylase RlpA family protein [Victivallales bacterium]|nr:septal ring lytic transglycosylase RlpA family protein [Victivallales bacterium]